MKNQGTKRHFNFIDIIILAVVAVLAAFAVFIFFGSTISELFFDKDDEDKYEYIRYTISMNTVDERYLDTITSIPELFRGDRSLGVIERIDISEVESIQFNERTGELVVTPYPGYKKVVLTLVAKGMPVNDSVYVADMKAVVGHYVEYKAKGFRNYGYITSCEKLDESEVSDVFKERLKTKKERQKEGNKNTTPVELPPPTVNVIPGVTENNSSATAAN